MSIHMYIYTSPQPQNLALQARTKQAVDREIKGTASERRGGNLKGFKDFFLEDKAFIGLYVPYSLNCGSVVCASGDKRRIWHAGPRAREPCTSGARCRDRRRQAETGGDRRRQAETDGARREG